ncbi:NAD(P)-dependent malic enzyme [Clostridium sp. UBA4548]|uniref:NAD(P)-dependent malic enzyme n=1 Tax=Clostridium sp. UBA4548 TaxID=1946361 RepID=UPI0025BC6493|nr:malic enzyme-like NAD(P)-binding protein [Clostridium sp. UBA4548]
MNLRERALEFHKINKGKIALHCKVSVENREQMTLAYTPGVAEPCLEINKDSDTIYDFTSKGNWIAIVTNGTAVLGLGDIGPGASLPVMEGKAVLFKAFGGIDAFPICLETKDPSEIINTVKFLQSSFGGVNLEDIKAPECFEIEEQLKKVCSIPIFHDDQHGTAVVSLACLFNSLKIVKKNLQDIRVVINGAGAAGIAIAKLLIKLKVNDVILCDTKGAIYSGRQEKMNKYKSEIAMISNKNKEKGSLREVLKDKDVFIGVSIGNCVDSDMIKSMNENAIIMAMANPNPEIDPRVAKEAGARVVCTGRSDYPNQVNNVLAFPGIFRGALDVRATDINDEMKIAAATAIAELISPEELREDYVIPAPFDLRIAPKVAEYVSRAAIETKVNRLTISPEKIKENTEKLLTK